METRDELESDWIHSVFEVLREEVVAIAADFGDRVKGEIDQVAAAQGVHPPSAAALFTSVAIESGNVAVGLFSRGDPPLDDDDDGGGDDEPAEDPKGQVSDERDDDDARDD